MNSKSLQLWRLIWFSFVQLHCELVSDVWNEIRPGCAAAAPMSFFCKMGVSGGCSCTADSFFLMLISCPLRHNDDSFKNGCNMKRYSSQITHAIEIRYLLAHKHSHKRALFTLLVTTFGRYCSMQQLFLAVTNFISPYRFSVVFRSLSWISSLCFLDYRSQKMLGSV